MRKDPYKHIRAYRTGWLLVILDWIIAAPILLVWQRKTSKSLKLDYLGDRKQIEKDIKHGAFFMTNHRDIVMDSAWLSLLLRKRYFIRPFIGIGNNLFAKKWIEHLVRFNRCFAVIRNGGAHAQLENAHTLSAYIAHLRQQGKSIWLAQREGRAKDSNDLTQPSVLHMLTINNDDFFQAIKDLNICPVSITYEYDPCDYLKAREMQLKRDNPKWRKRKRDDVESMVTGIKGQKGRVVYRLTPSINPEIDHLLAQHPEYEELPLSEKTQIVCRIIDKHIHLGYEMYERGTEFEQYIESRLQLIDIPNKDDAYLRERLYEMYENPVKNYQAALTNTQKEQL